MYKRQALTTAYAISESALKNYQEKVVETIGKNKEQSVRDAMAKDAISKKQIQNSEVIITKKGDTLCFDVLSGRYFKSDIERIKRAENDIKDVYKRQIYDIAKNVVSPAITSVETVVLFSFK